MGVAGSGKKTIAKFLSEKINAFLIKMRDSIVPNDNDRYDLLIKLKEEIDKRRSFQNLDVACSALKEKYRSILNVKEEYLVYLKITKNTSNTRIKNRQGHFMPDSLVNSQFAILEEPDVCITLDETLKPDEMITHLTSIIENKFDYGR